MSEHLDLVNELEYAAQTYPLVGSDRVLAVIAELRRLEADNALLRRTLWNIENGAS